MRHLSTRNQKARLMDQVQNEVEKVLLTRRLRIRHMKNHVSLLLLMLFTNIIVGSESKEFCSV